MPNPETITFAPHEADHQALVEMLNKDKAQGKLSPEDTSAYHELVDQNRTASQEATRVEVKDANTGEQTVEVAPSIGDEAIKNAMAVHSGNWLNERK